MLYYISMYRDGLRPGDMAARDITELPRLFTASSRFADCSDVSAIICMFKNCFIAESDRIFKLFAGEYLCHPIYFCSIGNLCFGQNCFAESNRCLSCSCQKGCRAFHDGCVQRSPPLGFGVNRTKFLSHGGIDCYANIARTIARDVHQAIFFSRSGTA